MQETVPTPFNDLKMFIALHAVPYLQFIIFSITNRYKSGAKNKPNIVPHFDRQILYDPSGF